MRDFLTVEFDIAAINRMIAYNRIKQGRLAAAIRAINAIRDDEDKAEAMGIPTLKYKRIGWGVAAIFMGAIGAVAGNMAGFIDKEVAYPIPTFGIFMVASIWRAAVKLCLLKGRIMRAM